MITPWHKHPQVSPEPPPKISGMRYIQQASQAEIHLYASVGAWEWGRSSWAGKTELQATFYLAASTGPLLLRIFDHILDSQTKVKCTVKKTEWENEPTFLVSSAYEIVTRKQVAESLTERKWQHPVLLTILKHYTQHLKPLHAHEVSYLCHSQSSWWGSGVEGHRHCQ